MSENFPEESKTGGGANDPDVNSIEESPSVRVEDYWLNPSRIAELKEEYELSINRLIDIRKKSQNKTPLTEHDKSVVRTKIIETAIKNAAESVSKSEYLLGDEQRPNILPTEEVKSYMAAMMDWPYDQLLNQSMEQDAQIPLKVGQKIAVPRKGKIEAGWKIVGFHKTAASNSYVIVLKNGEQMFVPLERVEEQPKPEEIKDSLEENIAKIREYFNKPAKVKLPDGRIVMGECQGYSKKDEGVIAADIDGNKLSEVVDVDEFLSWQKEKTDAEKIEAEFEGKNLRVLVQGGIEDYAYVGYDERSAMVTIQHVDSNGQPFTGEPPEEVWVGDLRRWLQSTEGGDEEEGDSSGSEESGNGEKDSDGGGKEGVDGGGADESSEGNDDGNRDGSEGTRGNNNDADGEADDDGDETLNEQFFPASIFPGMKVKVDIGNGQFVGGWYAKKCYKKDDDKIYITIVEGETGNKREEIASDLVEWQAREVPEFFPPEFSSGKSVKFKIWEQVYEGAICRECFKKNDKVYIRVEDPAGKIFDIEYELLKSWQSLNVNSSYESVKFYEQLPDEFKEGTEVSVFYSDERASNNETWHTKAAFRKDGNLYIEIVGPGNQTDGVPYSVLRAWQNRSRRIAKAQNIQGNKQDTEPDISSKAERAEIAAVIASIFMPDKVRAMPGKAKEKANAGQANIRSKSRAWLNAEDVPEDQRRKVMRMRMAKLIGRPGVLASVAAILPHM